MFIVFYLLKYRGLIWLEEFLAELYDLIVVHADYTQQMNPKIGFECYWGFCFWQSLKAKIRTWFTRLLLWNRSYELCAFECVLVEVKTFSLKTAVLAMEVRVHLNCWKDLRNVEIFYKTPKKINIEVRQHVVFIDVRQMNMVTTLVWWQRATSKTLATGQRHSATSSAVTY